jgi:hypothetical protein
MMVDSKVEWQVLAHKILLILKSLFLKHRSRTAVEIPLINQITNLWLFSEFLNL